MTCRRSRRLESSRFSRLRRDLAGGPSHDTLGGAPALLMAAAPCGLSERDNASGTRPCAPRRGGSGAGLITRGVGRAIEEMIDVRVEIERQEDSSMERPSTAEITRRALLRAVGALGLSGLLA